MVIVHGHSSDLSRLGEQYSDEVKDDSGNIIQREGSHVQIEDILNKYDDPSKFAGIVLNGCNSKKGLVEAKKVPVFYPMVRVKYNSANPQFKYGPDGGLALPKNYS